MRIDKAEVERIARLARLALTPEETERYARELTRILDYMEQIRGCDTEGVSPELHPGHTENVLREDRPEASLPREQALKNAPDSDGIHFRVPPVLPSSEH